MEQTEQQQEQMQSFQRMVTLIQQQLSLIIMKLLESWPGLHGSACLRDFDVYTCLNIRLVSQATVSLTLLLVYIHITLHCIKV